MLIHDFLNAFKLAMEWKFLYLIKNIANIILKLSFILWGQEWDT